MTGKRVSTAGEDRLLTAVNKWLIGHPEGDLDEGAFLGLKGVKIDIFSISSVENL